MISVAETKLIDVIRKLRSIEVEISVEKGNFTLFALIEREDSLGKWDIVISAKWIKEKEKEIINIIASKLQRNLTEIEQLMFSRVVVLPPSDPFIKNIYTVFEVEHGTVKVSNFTLNGITLKEAYLITSKTK